jgi:hypothetical protein
LRNAYQDILTTNDTANEYNYMIDVFHAIKDHYMSPGEGAGLSDDPKGWRKLF